MRSPDVIMSEGVDCLLEKLGILETEIFISNLLRKKPFDYTEWRRDHLFPGMSPNELNRQAAQYAREHYERPVKKTEPQS